MSKISCKVIADLLPLYCDEACSDESRTIVDEHLAECEDCRRLSERLSRPEHKRTARAQKDELAALAAVRVKWLKSRVKALIIGILIAGAAVLVGTGVYVLLTMPIIPVATEKIELSDVAMIDENILMFHILIDDGYELKEVSIDCDNETGIAYITPKRAVINERGRMVRSDGSRGYMSLNDRTLYVELLPFASENLLSPANEEKYREYQNSREYYEMEDITFTSDIQTIYLGTPDDNVVLWQAGMDMPQASEAARERFISGVR